MQTTTGLTGAEFDAMVECGAFERIGPKKIELIQGERRVMNPAGPIHDDYIDYLTDWSYQSIDTREFRIRVQSGIVCDDSRDIRIVVPPNPLAPLCKPTALLDLAVLFSVQ
jgi:hypothetical protein